MNRRKWVAFVTSLAVVGCMLPWSVLCASAQVRSAKLFSVQGSVTVRRGGDQELPGFEGMRLQEGDILITAPDSYAVVEIDGDKTVNVEDSTEIMFSDLSGSPGESRTSISVFFGGIVNSIRNKLTKGSVFDTTTSTAVMGVRGTTYYVGQGTSEVRLLVSSGVVSVNQTDEADQPPVEVEKGNMLSAGRSRSAEPVTYQQLLELKPAAARVLVDETLWISLQKPQGAAETIDQLMEVLRQEQVKQADQAARVEAQALMESNTAGAAQQVNYFEQSGAKLTGFEQAQVSPASPPGADAVPPVPAAASGGGASAETSRQTTSQAGVSNQNTPSRQDATSARPESSTPSMRPSASSDTDRPSLPGYASSSSGSSTGSSSSAASLPGSSSMGSSSSAASSSGSSSTGSSSSAASSSGSSSTGSSSGASSLPSSSSSESSSGASSLPSSSSTGSSSGASSLPSSSSTGSSSSAASSSGSSSTGSSSSAASSSGSSSTGSSSSASSLPSSSSSESSSSSSVPGEPVLAMGEVTQESVALRGSDEVVALAFTWQDVPGADGYKIAYDTGGGSFDELPDAVQLLTKGSSCRVLLPADAYDGDTLRFVPISNAGLETRHTAVRARVGAPSQTIMLLEPPDLQANDQRPLMATLTWTVQRGVEKYRLYVLNATSGEVMMLRDISASSGGEGTTQTYELYKQQIGGSERVDQYLVQLQAIGDGFDLLNSDRAQVPIRLKDVGGLDRNDTGPEAFSADLAALWPVPEPNAPWEPEQEPTPDRKHEEALPQNTILVVVPDDDS